MNNKVYKYNSRYKRGVDSEKGKENLKGSF